MKKSKNENFNPNKLKNLNYSELQKVLQEEVFDTPDFKRHMKELSVIENMEIEEVTKVVKHYLLSNGKEMLKIKKHKRRFVLFGFLTIDIQEIIYNEHSIYYKQSKNKDYAKSKSRK